MAIAIASIGTTREGTLRVLVAVNTESERRLAARLEGQTNDLDVDVVVSYVGPDLDPAQLAVAARAEAKTRRAEIAVWFVSESDGWLVHVARGERTFQRRVSVSSGALSSSAAIEAVAVAVRTAAMGLSAADEDVVVEKRPEPAHPPTPVRFIGELNWTAALDRPGSGGHHGIEARLGLGFGGVRFTLGLEEHPPERIAATQATILLERQVGALSAAYDAPVDPRVRLGGALSAELLHFARTTTSVTNTLMVTSPKSSWSFAVRPELHLAFRLVWAVWLSLHVGADVLFAAPTFAVEVSGTTQTVVAQWAVQPRVSLALALDFE